jgi:rubrerythrin
MKKVLITVFVCIMVIGLATIAQSTEMYPETQKNLMYAVTGETQAAANYRAFASVAEEEGHKEIAAIFRAISNAEEQHAADEFRILQSVDPSVVKPVAGEVKTGTTKENLQAAIDGETEEFTVMYPGFIATANKENMLDARGIFTIAKLAEEVHAGIYADLLKNFDNFDKEKYAKIYRCPECGNIIPTIRPMACPICGDEGEDLVEYEIVN